MSCCLCCGPMEGSSFPLCLIFLIFSLTYVKLSLCSSKVEQGIVEELADNIGRRINDFAVQITGSAAVGKNLSTLQLKAEKNNGTKLVEDISKEMHTFFDTKIESLRNVVVRGEKVHENYEYDYDIAPFPYMDMKNYKSWEYNLTFDSDFKRNVTFSVSGIQVPTDIYNEDPEILNTIKWSESLDEIFKNNREQDPDLKWQYFGSETGVLRSYPAKEWKLGPKNIDLYDARKRSWYIHGSASPKTVVIVVDSSGSMYGRPMLIARLAVGELIDTFSENDFFNIIWFNKDVHYLACTKTFVQATTQNKDFYKNRLKDIKASYVAIWPKAFEAAFKLLQENEGAKCQKVIMAFTDGATERSSHVFEKYNADKKVRVFTYAVGPPAHSVEALRVIACKNKGFFYRIPGVGSVRDVVKGYVSVLSRPMAENKTHDTIWSSVYRDVSGLGMLITGTLPLFHRTNQTGIAKILGVTGTDVPLDDINRLYDHRMLGSDGYLYLINNNGHIVKHPALKFNLGYLEDPPGVDVSDIEFAWEVNSTEPETLREKMLKESVGTMSFDVAKFSNDEFHRRVKKKSMNYFFTTIEDSPLRVGIASPKLGFKIDRSAIAEVNETLISFLTNYWKNVPQTSENDVEAFVQTFTGTFKNSRSNSEFKPEEGIEGRIEEYPENITVLSVPYNLGKSIGSNITVTGYRNVRANVSGGTLSLAVVGFNVNNSYFLDNFKETTKDGGHSCDRKNKEEDEGYYCYLLDENAFVVGANAFPEVVTGQFFGKVDSEIMKHLVKGYDSSLSNPIYEKVVKHDYQGSCTERSGSSSSSATWLQPLLSVTSYVKWCTTKTVWLILHLNVYNWLYGGQTYVSGESTEITKTKNRSCIMAITAYYANVTDTNVQKGEAYCGINYCVSSDASECQRSFVVSKVPKTNLFLLVVDSSHGRCATTKTDPILGIPGEHVEFIKSAQQQEQSVCDNDRFRRSPSRCYTSDKPETDYPCGRGSLVTSSWIFIPTLFVSSVIRHYL